MIYTFALNSGAEGGKLLGAGGWILFFMLKNNHKKFINKMKKTLILPFQFDETGSNIIVNTEKHEK